MYQKLLTCSWIPQVCWDSVWQVFPLKYRAHRQEGVCMFTGMTSWALGECHHLQVVIIMSTAASWYLCKFFCIYRKGSSRGRTSILFDESLQWAASHGALVTRREDLRSAQGPWRLLCSEILVLLEKDAQLRGLRELAERSPACSRRAAPAVSAVSSQNRRKLKDVVQPGTFHLDPSESVCSPLSPHSTWRLQSFTVHDCPCSWSWIGSGFLSVVEDVVLPEAAGTGGLRPAVLPGCVAQPVWAGHSRSLHSSEHREHGMQVQHVRLRQGPSRILSDNRRPSIRQWGHSPLAGDAGWGPGALRHIPTFMLQACVIYVAATTLFVLFVLRSFSVFYILGDILMTFCCFLMDMLQLIDSSIVKHLDCLVHFFPKLKTFCFEQKSFKFTVPYDRFLKENLWTSGWELLY